MREIKFRGFTDDEATPQKNKWVFGDFYRKGNNSLAGDEETMFFIRENNLYDRKIAPNSLGEYTGLKDKFGKEIYEGDIVEFLVDEPLAENREKRIIVGFVDFDRGSFWLNTKKRFYDGANYTDETLLSNFAYCCEVVGNIYEKPQISSTPSTILIQDLEYEFGGAYKAVQEITAAMSDPKYFDKFKKDDKE